MNKKYTIIATCMGGTYLAGEYFTDSAEKALAMAKEDDNDEGTYYVQSEEEVNPPRNFLVGYFKDGVIYAFEFEEGQVLFGNCEDAHHRLKHAEIEMPAENWEIFWIKTENKL